MSLLKKRPLQLILASSAAVLAACGGSSSDSASTGSMSLSVTDAAIDSASHVYVEFSGVSIQPAEGERIEFTFDDPKNIDLLALQGSASESLLTDEEVPAGEYEWIRLHVNAENDGVTDSYLEKDGNQYELWVPSGSQSGLKLVSGFTVLAGGSSDFTIDFDLRKSVIMPPSDQIGGAILKPALRLIDNTQSGTIAGTVSMDVITDQCEMDQTGAVYVFSGADATLADMDGTESDPLTTALVNETDEGFAYEAAYIGVGDYTVAYTCDANLDEPESEEALTFLGVTNATVEVDATTEVNFTADALGTEVESEVTVETETSTEGGTTES